jgi:hypothetical protein
VLSVVAPTPVRPVAFLQDYGYHQSQAMSSNETGIGVDFVENTRNVPQYTTLLSPESRFLLYDMPLPNPDDFEYVCSFLLCSTLAWFLRDLGTPFRSFLATNAGRKQRSWP